MPRGKSLKGQDLFFKNPRNLNKEKKEDERLERLLAQSSPFAKKYILKENF
jgi:hypothetical protein